MLGFCENVNETPVCIKYKEYHNQLPGRILISEEIYTIETFNYNVRILADSLVRQIIRIRISGVLQYEIRNEGDTI